MARKPLSHKRTQSEAHRGSLRIVPTGRFAAYPLLRRKLQQYQHILVPLVLIAIGLSVLLG